MPPVSIGPVHFSRTFFLAADKDLLIRVSDLEDAVIFLMLYYIFWIEHPACCKCSCSFATARSQA